MSSIVVKGLNAPECCADCPMSHWDEIAPMGCLAVEGKAFTEECADSVPEWCPIVELPTHGDLIDKQAFIEKMLHTSRYFSVRFDIEEMPVVLEADNGE